ncbi:DUF4145 domain-containing protein [Leuconostoc gelidum subsp. gasicomitatum]|uniref:DUF4145 domain-containing protein n=1 Tax=Leuconostoc gasicomitatum TaxID=115778 RepID=UPI001CC3FA22|nr:DUF4145 domain-containing protein [Leuconostoc gasicomitatum]MBZ5943947.1 DUF4145 domain-containing protein [Leuconostoc gasicomitatum]MBZ5973057.1 DUF4145 domain-containing protein [Leuconostoc gasicomitatum]
MEFINQEIYYESSWIKIQLPKFCPHCGAVNNPKSQILSRNKIKTSDKEEIVISVTHFCNACNKSHFSIEVQNDDNSFSIKSVYPETQPTLLADEVTRLSPRFAKVYADSEAAEQRGATELAGTGYRSALEILIKDYALKYSGDTKEAIAKLNLSSAIQKYFNGDVFNAAEVVRLLGNDYTHWEKQYDFKLSQLKAYLDIFVSYIKMQVMVKEPIVSKRIN